MAGNPPDGAIPEPLRQKQDCHDRQSHKNPKENPAPIQNIYSLDSFKSNTADIKVLYGLYARVPEINPPFSVISQDLRVPEEYDDGRPGQICPVFGSAGETSGGSLRLSLRARFYQN